MEKINIICCSTDNWDDIWRRRQHICQELSKRQWINKILFIEPPVSVWSILKGGSLKQFGYVGKVRKIKSNIEVYRPFSLMPFVRFNLMRILNMYLYLLQVKLVARRLGLSHIISWFSNPTYVTIAGKFNELCFWYDCTDDWSQMPGNTKSMTLLAKKQQNAILKLADIVTAVSESLYKNAKRINSNSHLVPNGVDVVFYSSAKRKIKELDNIKKPIFGYVGSIWEDRLDISLIKYLAKNKPEWSFVFIGPITIELKSDIKGIENLFFLGKRPYKDLPSYMNEFDVCLIPHKVNELTNSMNPIKLFEYMATGKPIVSTDVAGVSEYSDVVMIAEDDNEFIEMCNKALNCNNDLADKQLEYASDNSWSRRVDKIESLMHETINNHS